MKILLFGKNGRIGRALENAMVGVHELMAPSRTECDVLQPAQVEKIFAQYAPDIIINATGFTRVDDAEKQQEEAYELNAEVPAFLAGLCRKRGIPFVHFSTDYVFDGGRSDGYAEDSVPHPLSAYGDSKAAGEDAIQKTLSDFFIIRTAWIFGPGGKNFVDTMLERAEAQKPIQVVTDQVGCPTYTIDLARAVLGLLKTKNYGIYHIVNGGSTSWYGLAEEIFRILGVLQKIEPITSRELNRAAKRPASSILLNTKLAPLRPWQEALADYLQNKTILL